MHIQVADLLFWSALALVLYAYVGYWLFLRLFSKKRPSVYGKIQPSVTIVIAARNEANRLPAKLKNLGDLSYPKDLLEIVVVSDGSTDETASILSQTPTVKSVILPATKGKAYALNLGVSYASGDLLVFLDARQAISLDSLEQLVNSFADPTVGAVSGELLLESQEGVRTGEALGLYWKIEKAIRRLESDSGSVVGVTGAIYAIRRELFVPMPVGLILDDVFVPMQVVRQNRRVLFQPNAVARDYIFSQQGKEFSRKVRTLTGNLQLLQAAPWLLSPKNPILFRFVSHKMMRLLVPWLLIVMLVASAISSRPVMHLLLGSQLLLFGFGGVGAALPKTKHWRIVGIPATFGMLNVAVLVAFYKVFAKKTDVWR